MCQLKQQQMGWKPEVDERDDLLRGHVDEQLPDRLLLLLGPEVPERVDDGRGGQVDDALLGSDPPQLAVAAQLPDPL